MASNKPQPDQVRTAIKTRPALDTRSGQQGASEDGGDSRAGLPAHNDKVGNAAAHESISSAEDRHRAARQARRKLVDRRAGDEDPQYPGINRRSDQDRRNKQGSKASENRDKPPTRQEMKVQQHRKKKLLAGCEPVMGLNYDTLAMDDYPSNEVVARARKDRDQWIAICSLFGSIFLFGFTGIVPALVAGISCGVAMLAFVLAFSPLRFRFFDEPSLQELLETRKRIEFRALNHIQFLEGDDGLAWRCEKMGKYNSNLNRKLFRGLILFSRSRDLMDVIRNRKQIRLYLLFMIEAQKAYKRLQRDYLENHFKHLDQGWDDTLSEAEVSQVERDDRDTPAA